jgi:hypothetical protein
MYKKYSEYSDSDLNKFYPVKFNKEQFDKYDFQYPTQASFRKNGYPFRVKEIILTDVVGSWDTVVTTECILGMVVATDERTQSPEALYWSTKTGNCGTNYFKLNRNTK